MPHCLERRGVCRKGELFVLTSCKLGRLLCCKSPPTALGEAPPAVRAVHEVAGWLCAGGEGLHRLPAMVPPGAGRTCQHAGPLQHGKRAPSCAGGALGLWG